jgi:hypothetical protein
MGAYKLARFDSWTPDYDAINSKVLTRVAHLVEQWS